MPIKPKLDQADEIPAPRPEETHGRLAPQYMPLVEDNLPEGLGVIPGEPPSRKVELVEDGLIAGRGVVPG